jgi:hypothetical protein
MSWLCVTQLRIWHDTIDGPSVPWCLCPFCHFFLISENRVTERVTVEVHSRGTEGEQFADEFLRQHFYGSISTKALGVQHARNSNSRNDNTPGRNT